MSDNAPPAWLDEAPPPEADYGGNVKTRDRTSTPPSFGVMPSEANAVAVISDPAERKVIEALSNSVYPGASELSIAMALSYCRVNHLDPFLKPVHIVPMSVKVPGTRSQYRWRDVLMPGIADYRIKASRSGEYLGKSAPEFGPVVEYNLAGTKVSVPEWCRITVRRFVKAHVAEFTAEEYWLENYATAGRDTLAPNHMWQRRARGQLAKCAEAQALRMAFPEFNGGMPTAEEMEGRFLDEPVSEAAAPVISGSKLEALERLISQQLGQATQGGAALQTPGDASPVTSSSDDKPVDGAQELPKEAETPETATANAEPVNTPAKSEAEVKAEDWTDTFLKALDKRVELSQVPGNEDAIKKLLSNPTNQRQIAFFKKEHPEQHRRIIGACAGEKVIVVVGDLNPPYSEFYDDVMATSVTPAEA